MNDFWNYIRDITNQSHRQPVDAVASLTETVLPHNNVNCDKNVDRTPESQSYHASSADQNVINSYAISAYVPKVCLGMVALELRNPDMEATAMVHALHDTGSEITMLRLSGVEKLDLTGVTKRLF